MQLDIITLFPEMCRSVMGESIMKRAQEQGRVTVNVIDLRDFTHDRHRTADDRPYGGGAGMVLKAPPLFEAVESVTTTDARVILLTPQGAPFRQDTARTLSREQHIVLVCGQYEGIDERARETLFDTELSIGDYVLTSGTLAALVVADALIRLVPGVLGCDESVDEESFGSEQLLEYPQYTRPAMYRGMKVPEILLSGDHEKIRRWRHEKRLARTAARRPDLLQNAAERDDEQT